MDPNENTPKQPKPPVYQEYQDHHFHDEEPELGEDDARRGKPPVQRPGPRRMPPPKRRFEDD